MNWWWEGEWNGMWFFPSLWAALRIRALQCVIISPRKPKKNQTHQPKENSYQVRRWRIHLGFFLFRKQTFLQGFTGWWRDSRASLKYLVSSWWILLVPISISIIAITTTTIIIIVVVDDVDHDNHHYCIADAVESLYPLSAAPREYCVRSKTL